jgi:hypothetical protein
MLPREFANRFTGVASHSSKLPPVTNRQSAIMMRRAPAFASILGLAVLAAAAPAAADSGPVIVIPTRPGVPVVINGYDASYAVVEGDWGLARPGHMAPTVIGGRPVLPNYVYSPRNSYHPRYGRPPARGRNEIEPPPDRALPEPAEPFYRGWSTSSEFWPAAISPPPLPGRARQFGSPADDPWPALEYPEPYDPPNFVMPRHRRR